jgi:hypothetical protein
VVIRASATDILGLRLRAQLIERSANDPVEAVRAMLAIQAQDFAQALWAVGLRTRASTRTQVLAALADGQVVRSLPMRGTLHFVRASDLRWMLSLTSERMLRSTATRFRTLGLDAQTLVRSEAIAIEALTGGIELTRSEFFSALEANDVSTAGQRGYHIIFYLSQRLVICWGPPKAAQQALVLVDEWIPRQSALGRDEALREFALRYFAGHGPATLRDFAWWTKLTLADARRAIDIAADSLAELKHADLSYWLASSIAAEPLPRLGTRTHVLPGFDEYLLGYQNRDLVLSAQYSERIVPGLNGIFLPVVVRRGRVTGSWRRRRAHGSAAASPTASIEADLFEVANGEDALAHSDAGFARAAKRYAAFMLG